MKLLLAGDPHFTDSKPKRRIDNFYETQLRKFNFILETAKKHKAMLFLPGDVFNSPRTSKKLISEIAKMIKSREILIVAVYGQHDTFFHSKNIENTSLNVLCSSGLIINSCDQDLKYLANGRLNIIFRNWWQRDDLEQQLDTSYFNILVIHKMVIDEKLWHDQTNYIKQDDVMKHGYDLVISGDNHKSFHYETKDNRFLFNPGSILRLSSKQIDHEPNIILFDTETKAYTIMNIPIEPKDKVFDLNQIEYEKEHNDNISDYIDCLEDDEIEGINFKKNIDNYFKKNKIETGIKNEIIEALNE